MLQTLLHLRRDLNPSDREHFGNRAVSSDHAHDRFGEVSQGPPGIPYGEQILPRSLDLILDHPLDVRDIEIAGQQKGFLRIVPGIVLSTDPCSKRPEPEFLLKHLSDGNPYRRLDAKRQLEVQARLSLSNVLAEPQYNRDLIGLDDVKTRRQHRKDEHGEDGQENIPGRNEMRVRPYFPRLLLHRALLSRLKAFSRRRSVIGPPVPNRQVKLKAESLLTSTLASTSTFPPSGS